MAYWKFSFEEMGEKDTPAIVEFILKETGVKKLTYVGYSQGNTQLFYALATNSAYWSDKLDVFVAVSPTTRLQNSPIPHPAFTTVKD